MNEEERKKFDAQEASGVLPALRAHAMSFCAPLWWEVGGHTILANGTICLVRTQSALFGVTNNHVLKIYERHKAENSDVFCQLGSAPFEPSDNVISRNEYWDLATFRVPDFTLAYCGRNPFVSQDWPPRPLKTGDTVILGGFPENRRDAPSGPRPPSMASDFVSFIAPVDNWSDQHMSFCFDSQSWYWPQGVSLESYPDLSGASGGPCYRFVRDEDRIELSGFIYEAHRSYEVIRVRQASLIGADGLIAECE